MCYSLGSLGNDDIDVSEKPATFHVHHAFFTFLDFFAVTARLRHENAHFTFCGGRERKTTTFHFFS